MTTKLLQYENIPCWYALWWSAEDRCMIVKISREYIRRMPYPDRSPIFAQSYEIGKPDSLFETLEPRLGKESFGFDDSIVLAEEDDDWLTYRINIPQAQFETGRTCPQCDGSGCRTFDGQIEDESECISCQGGKKERVLEWEKVNRACISLSVLFSAIEFPPEEDIATDEKQLFTVKAGLGEKGCYLGGQMSPHFIELLKRGGLKGQQVPLEEVMTAEMEAYRKIFVTLGHHDRYSFRAWVNDGNLVIDCPGDACGIHPSPYVHDIREGTEFTCHNLDSGYQLLTLLAGLAATASMFID